MLQLIEAISEPEMALKSLQTEEIGHQSWMLSYDDEEEFDSDIFYDDEDDDYLDDEDDFDDDDLDYEDDLDDDLDDFEDEDDDL